MWLLAQHKTRSIYDFQKPNNILKFTYKTFKSNLKTFEKIQISES